MTDELVKLRGQQIPITTRSGGRHQDYVHDVRDGVVVLSTNADGTGRRTLIAIEAIESISMAVSRDGAIVRYR